MTDGGFGPAVDATAARRFVTDVRVRYSDLDAQGHVNNARVLTLLEEARVDWLYADASRHGADQLVEALVVAHLTIHYRRPLQFGPPARVSLGVSAVGRASFTVDYVITSESEVVATASTVLVAVGVDDGRPLRLGDRERRYLARYQAPYLAGERPTLRDRLNDSGTDGISPRYAAWGR
ncbi:MAG: thioesterase family protein [Nakamurella sp.]